MALDYTLLAWVFLSGTIFGVGIMAWATQDRGAP
jgi:hypothetical protein